MIVLANDIPQQRGVTECANMLSLACLQDDAGGLSFAPETHLGHSVCAPDGRKHPDCSMSARMPNVLHSSLNNVPRSIPFSSADAKQRPVQRAAMRPRAHPFGYARKVV